MIEPLTLQLHITDRCQLQCRHCYRDERRQELPVETLLSIVDGFAAFCQRRDLPGRLTIAGGEPLLRYDDLLRLCRRAQEHSLQVHLLTNGLLLTAERIGEMKTAGVMRAQISVDGDAAAHDSLRGPGAYDHTVRALDLLRQCDMWSTLSMTLGKWNLASLPHVIELAKRCHAKLFVSRFVPCGAGVSLQGEILSASEWREVMQTCRRLRHKAGVALRDPLYTPLTERRPAQHACIGGCAIGHGGLAVDSDGTAYPCRRLPLPLGNLACDSFEQVWRHPTLEALRNRDALAGRCGKCRWRWRCGGCRAIAHAVSGDMQAEDPQCCFG